MGRDTKTELKETLSHNTWLIGQIEAKDKETAAYHTRGLELAKALSACIAAIAPPDRGGISMHEWNQRLKAAQKQACAALTPVSPTEPKP